jgi:hypothetical protein
MQYYSYQERIKDAGRGPAMQNPASFDNIREFLARFASGFGTIPLDLPATPQFLTVLMRFSPFS